MKEDSSNGPVIPAGTVPFNGQVAGHSLKDGRVPLGLLKYKDGCVLKPIYKPIGIRERVFYESIFESKDSICLQLQKFLPKYFGTLQLPFNGTDVTFLKLQDVTEGLNKPCIMDIKIGRQTWEPGATDSKRIAEESKYAESKNTFGFSILGYQVYDLTDGSFIKMDKASGKALTAETLPKALSQFLNRGHGSSNHLVNSFLTRLLDIQSWWSSQRLYHMYASSILLLYDASELHSLSSRPQPKDWVRVFMIDFVHVVSANTLDHNYMAGITSLIDLMKSYLIVS